MEKSEIYQALEDDFTSTFIYELLPGILHNFANPLNGIMGRSKLLQRRIDDAVKKIGEQYPETASGMQEELQRIKNDIRSVNKESESFFDMFRDASGKFYALAARGDDRINIGQLLTAEMRFANFYLEFKHEITKNVQIDSDLPEIKGNVAELSLVFWRMIRFAMTRAMQCNQKDYSLLTRHDSENITVLIKYSGQAVSYEDGESIDAGMEKGVLLALDILKKYLAQVHFFEESGLNVISVTIPYRNLQK